MKFIPRVEMKNGNGNISFVTSDTCDYLKRNTINRTHEYPFNTWNASVGIQSIDRTLPVDSP